MPLLSTCLTLALAGPALPGPQSSRPTSKPTSRPASVHETKRSRPMQMVEGQPMYTVLEQDGIPAIDEPSWITTTEAFDTMADDETVLGMVGKDGTAKALSTWHLDRHEIVNDVLDGRPISATW